MTKITVLSTVPQPPTDETLPTFGPTFGANVLVQLVLNPGFIHVKYLFKVQLNIGGGFFKMAIPGLFFLYFRLFNTIDIKQMFDKSLPMSGFELRISSIRGDRSTN